MTKIWVDPARCQGHARCFMIAPETFFIDDEGYGHVVEGREGAFEEENTRKAIRNCPERAIKLIETEDA
ncbi:ferredoxin [Microbacterium sp. C5A9]|uniref:ferredoxin n=1 Tax=Microbacterium sp. C5A9 TaxID=2736663 RepID=UPI001F51A880|nr:ferredoxin [Microbacterium sp. C5A9]MCI1017331.1 ferredoxin [Microbacterium sp. C5A9]